MIVYQSWEYLLYQISIITLYKRRRDLVVDKNNWILFTQVRMDSISNFKEEVSKRLECLICMDRLRNPKDLHCHHTFCKECLEGVLKFRKDGSAIIKCPLRCNGQTVIPKDNTTKDLASPFNLKGILEMFEEGIKKPETNKTKPLCTAEENCPNEIESFCTNCNVMLCHLCQLKHDGDKKTHTYIPLQYQEKEGQLKIMCNEHSTIAKYVCCEGKYICVFCRFRDHLGHTHHTIELQGKRTKELLAHHVKKVDKMKKLLQKSLIAAETSITHCKELLSKSLKARKLLCLSNYLKFLNKKEEQIQRDFDAISSKHIHKYKTSQPIGYFDKAVNYEGARLILERESILLSIAQCNSGNVGIPLLSLHLTEANYNDKNSLGVLRSEVKDNVSLLDSETKASVRYDISLPDLCKIDFAVMDELKTLLDEAIERKYEFGYKTKEKNGVTKRRRSITVNVIPESTKNQEEEIQEKEITIERIENVVITPRRKSIPSTCLDPPDVMGRVDDANLANNMDRQNVTRGNAIGGCIESPTATITKEEKRIQKKVSKEVLKNLKKQGINYVYDLIRENDEETFDLLISTKSDVGRMRGTFGSTPLLTAGRFNRVEILKKLLDHGSTVDDKGSSGSNVLHISAFHDSCEALSWLLPRCQHLVDDKNSGDNRTALHYAASNGYLRCMKLLLKHGASINVKDKDDCTPLDKAKELNKQACVEELQCVLIQRAEKDEGKYADCRTAEECRTRYDLYNE